MGALVVVLMGQSLTCWEALKEVLQHLDVARHLFSRPEHLVRLAIVAPLSLLPHRDTLARRRRVQQPVVDPEVLRDEHIPAVQDGLGTELLAGHLRNQQKGCLTGSMSMLAIAMRVCV